MKNLTRLTLRLGRNPDAGYPVGDDRHGYVIVAPIGHDGRLDLETWRAKRKSCTVHRFTPEHADDADGLLSHTGAHWVFHYGQDHGEADEDLFRLADHCLFLGDYVTISDPDGTALVYRITEAVELG